MKTVARRGKVAPALSSYERWPRPDRLRRQSQYVSYVKATEDKPAQPET